LEPNNKKNQSKPKILPLPNGPYYLLNDMEPRIVDNLQNYKGESLSTIIGIALCRCGASKNKPFCDGALREINFKDEKD
jgi:CDGSH-type Zn-finger protein